MRFEANIWEILGHEAEPLVINIATGETSQAITPFHSFDNFNFHH